MSTNSENNKNEPSTLYQIIASQFGVTPRYVGKIARNERTPVRGVGLEVKKAIDLVKAKK
ncbi:XRE family transcriptional regulator [Tenacibaculum maritimum]|nr:XRE family transcriptional regulator [Tenacibaculum maritimum]MDB0602609.1 XRE family transcriptional regulator [Tenacibaculum maritimum]MDB0611279.1 XRE family transcriptional regulator [Tenacibaculum maritimum]